MKLHTVGYGTKRNFHIVTFFHNFLASEIWFFFSVKKIKRHHVPAGQISWDVPFDHYDPMCFDAPHLATAPYADPDIHDTDFKPKFNQIGK